MPHWSSSEESLYDSSPIRAEVPNARSNSAETISTTRIDSGFGSSKGRSLDNVSQIFEIPLQNSLDQNARIENVIFHPPPKDDNIYQIKCFYTNAQGIRQKFSDLRMKNLFESYDVIGISETWINLNRDLLEDFAMEGYASFNIDRSIRPGLDSFTNGGGVLIYVKKKYDPVRLNYPNPSNFYVESIWVELKLSQQKFNLGLVYRPSKQEKGIGFHHNVGDLIHTQIKDYCTTDSFVVMGNFNYINIDWKNPIYGKDNEETKFATLLKELRLHQRVDQPTCGENFIDLVICRDENIVKNIKYEDGLQLSDYKILTFMIEIPILESQFQQKDNCCGIL